MHGFNLRGEEKTNFRLLPNEALILAKEEMKRRGDEMKRAPHQYFVISNSIGHKRHSPKAFKLLGNSVKNILLNGRVVIPVFI